MARLRGQGAPAAPDVHGRVHCNATRILFEQAGFTHIRSKGVHHPVMRKTVPSTDTTSTRTRVKR